MRRLEFSHGEFYHLYNRGVDKRSVFLEPREYKRFLVYLYTLNTEENIRPTDILETENFKRAFTRPRTAPLVAIGAYCLMPNHFHLYVTQISEGGISRFMHKLSTAYTMYFNAKHERTGALFQGTFKAERVAREAYARYLFSYIHLNPAKIKEPKWKEQGTRDLLALEKFIDAYPYSSLQEYRERKHVITNPDKFPEYLRSARDIRRHIREWLGSRDKMLEA